MKISARARDIAQGLTKGHGLTPQILAAVKGGAMTPHARAACMQIGLLGLPKGSKVLGWMPIRAEVLRALDEIVVSRGQPTVGDRVSVRGAVDLGYEILPSGSLGTVRETGDFGVRVEFDDDCGGGRVEIAVGDLCTVGGAS